MKKKTNKKILPYVDGFVLSVPKKNLAVYKKMAGLMAKLCKKYGALEYKECVGEDLSPNTHGMKFLSFSQLAKPKKGEAVLFSYVVYKSRKHRDEVNKAMMNDPSMNDPKLKNMKMPFDMRRMAYGGFQTIVSL